MTKNLDEVHEQFRTIRNPHSQKLKQKIITKHDDIENEFIESSEYKRKQKNKTLLKKLKLLERRYG